MRLIGKLLALPFMLVTGILYLVCKFLVVLSGAVLGILSGYRMISEVGSKIISAVFCFFNWIFCHDFTPY